MPFVLPTAPANGPATAMDPADDSARCVYCGHFPGCECPEFCMTVAQERALFARARGSHADGPYFADEDYPEGPGFEAIAAAYYPDADPPF
jgi:hypothetical protein